MTRLGSKVFLLVLLAAASAQAGEIFGGPPKGTNAPEVPAACSGAGLQGEASCPSCGACYNYEAPEYTFLLAEQTYDAKDDSTVVSFLVTPPADCSYASFGIKLQAGVSTLPTLALPTSQGFLPAPTIVSGCDANTGLSNSLVFRLDGPAGPDQYGTYTAMLKLRGKWSMHDLFVPVAASAIVNGNGDDVTPFKTTASADTFMVTLTNSPNTVCGAAPACSFATVTAAAVPVTSESGLAFVSSTLDPTVFPSTLAPAPGPESPESPESPEPVPPTPSPAPGPTIPIILPPFPAPGPESPESPESPEPNNGTVGPFVCPQYYNVWSPQCFDKSPACPQVWSSASNLNPYGSEVSVQRQYSSSTDRTTFTFNIRWGAIGCDQYAGSALPVESLCTMNHFVLPLVAGVVPEKFGYLTPLVPGATDMDAITLQPGCDVGQDSGLQNTATWSLDVVEPATRAVLMKEGGVFASIIFIGNVEYQQAFAMITDDSFVASNTGVPVPGLISIPWGSVSFLVAGADGWTANGYYQYMASPPPPPVDQPSVPGFTPAPTPSTPGTVGASSINTIQVPGIGLATFTINADGSVTISGVGTLSVHGTPGGPAYVTIPGIGEVLIPGYLVPSSEVGTSSVVNGTIPVAASAEIVIDHAICSGDLTVTAAVSGALAPIITLTPAAPVTLTFGKTQKIAVSVTGKTMDSGYNGMITLTLASSDPACSASILASMVSASSVSMGTGKAVASMTVLAPSSATTIPVALNMDVLSPTLSGVKPAVMTSMLSLKQSLDPTGAIINWAPSTPYCSFTGVTCNSQGAITAVNIAGMGLTGSLPTDAATWAALSTIASFTAAGNGLTGPIPAGLAALTSAAVIDLSGNSLAGTIPASLASLSPAASVSLDNNARVCGGVPRTVSDAIALSFAGTSVATPCFESAIVMLAGAKSAAVGENTRLTTVAAPSPAYVEAFDAEATEAELTSTPFIGSLAVDGKALTIGSKVSFAALAGSKVVYTLNAGAAPQAVDTFTFAVAGSTVTFTVVQQIGSSGFPAGALVTVQGDMGPVPTPLSALKVGDKVLSACGTTACYTDVYIVPVQATASDHAYVELTTDFGNTLVLGGSQYVSASSDGKTYVAVTADYVEVGQYIQVINPVNSADLAAAKVTSMAWVSAPGQVLPLTLKGSIIVSGAAVSVYNDAMGSVDKMEAALKPLQTAYTNMQGAPAGDAAFQAAYLSAAASAASMMAKAN